MKTNKKGPGRPKYNPIIPKGKFTMDEFCVANGVNLNTGKGKLCSRLTLIKFLARDMFHTKAGSNKPDHNKPRKNSSVVLVKDEFSEPNSKDGLGRKAFVYIRRSTLEAIKARKASKVAKKTTAPATPAVTDSGTDAYEKQKAEILAPAVTVPAPTPEPVTETTETVAPVTETPTEPVEA